MTTLRPCAVCGKETFCAQHILSSDQCGEDDSAFRAWQGAERRAVVTCSTCGGKYRPAGGPCIHEHPAPRQETGTVRVHDEVWRTGFVSLFDSKAHYSTWCGLCGDDWQPGHTCMGGRASTEEERQRQWGQLEAVAAEARRLADEEPSALDPENWN